MVARYLRGALSDGWFVALLALCVTGIFATFLETLFWATIGGAVALGAGLAVTRGSERARIVRCLLLGVLASVIALLAASPYLWFVVAHSDPLAVSGRGFELDLANLIVPTRVTEIRPGFVHDMAERLGGQNLTEQVGYIGPCCRCWRASPSGSGAASRSPGCSR